MKISRFGQKLGAKAGIVALMEDLGNALNVNPDLLFLGGGNPANVPEFNAYVAKHMHSLANAPERLQKMVGVYQSPRGAEEFVDALVPYLNNEMGWKVGKRNVAVLSGSQSAFFILLNMFSGKSEFAPSGQQNIVFPMLPEYLGYADQTIDPSVFKGFLPKVDFLSETRFKYHLDSSAIRLDENAGAMCVSRPTNPTGNILTADEMEYLSKTAHEHNIPLIVDCAYGQPFPGISYNGAENYFDERNIHVFSCSKLGLPGLRTAVVVGPEDIIERVVNINTLINLANGNFGTTLMTSFLTSGELPSICRDTLLPFYRQKRDFAVACVDKYFAGLPYALHEPEGAFFLWLWLQELPVSSAEFYERMKARGVLIMDGEHFFFGHEQASAAIQQCLRLTYCQSEQVIEQGIALMADELRNLMEN